MEERTNERKKEEEEEETGSTIKAYNLPAVGASRRGRYPFFLENKKL